MMQQEISFLKKANSVDVTACHVAGAIDLKQFKQDFAASLLSASSSELFYLVENDGFLYLSNYGVLVYANMPEIEMSRVFSLLRAYCQDYQEDRFVEKLTISVSKTKGRKIHVDFDDVLHVPNLDTNIMQLVMFNLSQAVIMEYYENISENLLREVRHYTQQLESRGRITLGKNKMLRFIGKTLNIKNRIVENFYIYVVPDLTWEDKNLNQINHALYNYYELRIRFKEVEYNFKNIDDNLAIFRELYHHRESNMLEIIIILLIFIEVLIMIFSKIL
jgi:uncharacterized Rmd1/YagE family protein